MTDTVISTLRARLMDNDGNIVHEFEETTDTLRDTGVITHDGKTYTTTGVTSVEIDGASTFVMLYVETQNLELE